MSFVILLGVVAALRCAALLLVVYWRTRNVNLN